MSNTGKLAELRGRTDRELLVLIQRELDRALTLADVAAAEKAYDRTVTLLPNVPDVRQEERAHVDATLKELRRRLDQIPAAARAQWHPASFAA
jgi:hypothetical protein